MRLQKVFLLANIIISGLILWVGFTIYQTWASTRSRPHQQFVAGEKKAVKNQSISTTPASLAAFQSVMKTNIFKTSRSAQGSPARKTPPVGVKETDLDLELKGTMIDDSGERFAVILDGKTREQQTYAEKDFINGTCIEKILADRVILNRKGTEEALLMSYESGPAPRQVTPRRRTPGRKVIRVPGPKRSLRVKRRLPVPVKRPPAEDEIKEGP